MAYLMAGDESHPADGGDGKPRFDRVVVKLSGEAFADSSVGFGLDYGKIDGVARQLVEVVDLGVQVAVVVGGATSSAGRPPRRPAWTGPGPTTWACWGR